MASKSPSKDDEVQTLGRSMAVLCITLLWIYSIFFGVEGNTVAPYVQEELVVESGDVVEEVLLQDVDVEDIFAEPKIANPPVQENDSGRLPEDVRENGFDVAPTPTPPQLEIASEVNNQPQNTTKTFYSFDDLFGEDMGQVEVENVLPLEWTFQRYGVLESMEMLGITDNAKYILKDNNNTHFVYLGNFSEAITMPVLQQWWNVVEIADKNDINQNVLLGDLVRFVNLPQFENIKVLVFVTFEQTNDTRFLQIDYDHRYKSKKEIQAMFDKRYDR